MNKRPIFWIALLLCLLLIPALSQAEIVETGTSGTVTWTLDDTGLVTVSGSGRMENYTSHGFSLTALEKITSAVVEEGVTYIGKYAFANMPELVSVTVKDGSTSIGDYAFAYSPKLREVHLADGISSIGGYAFYGCKSLTSFAFPNGMVKVLGFPPVLYDCPNLTTVSIPASVTTLSNGAFITCEKLQAVNVDPANAVYSSIDGVVFNKDQTELVYYPTDKEDTSYRVPDTVIKVGSFGGNKHLTSVTIPEGATEIYLGFSGCSALKEVSLPSTMTEIGASSFSNCTSLGFIQLPENLTVINDYTFYNCTRLESIQLPPHLTTIGSYAFGGTYLRTVNIPASVTRIDDYAFLLSEYYYYNTLFIVAAGSYGEEYVRNNSYYAVINRDGAYDESICPQRDMRKANISIIVDPTGKYVINFNTKLGNPPMNLLDIGDQKSGATVRLSYEYDDDKKLTAVTLSGINLLYGEQTVYADQFLIDFPSCDFSVANATYTGSALKPTVKATCNGTKLTKGTDFTVTYKNNVKAGTATAIVKGKGKYTGTKELTFTVKPAKLSKTTVAAVADQTYTGKALKPAVTVTFGTKTLKKNTDYTVAYKENKYIGKATITLTGKGNFTGTKTVTFKIVPKGTTISKLTGASKKVTVTWKKQATSTAGYQIEYSTSKTFKSSKTVTVSNVKTLTKAISGLKAKTTYYFRVRTFGKVDNVKYYSAWSAVKSVKTK
ncbi:MAG: leucine-rich repeat protein [Clostridia bacterium]|nr:leucine-rich repeat protein [Clostridia bacterium]